MFYELARKECSTQKFDVWTHKEKFWYKKKLQKSWPKTNEADVVRIVCEIEMKTNMKQRQKKYKNEKFEKIRLWFFIRREKDGNVRDDRKMGENRWKTRFEKTIGLWRTVSQTNSSGMSNLAANENKGRRPLTMSKMFENDILCFMTNRTMRTLDQVEKKRNWKVKRSGCVKVVKD